MIALLNHMKQFSTYVVNSAERLTVELELRLGGGGGGYAPVYDLLFDGQISVIYVIQKCIALNI